MKTKTAAYFAGVCLLLGSTLTYAAEVKSEFDVTISITSSCDISSLGNGITTLAFGPNDSFQTNVNGESNLTVTCTKGAAYQVGLDAGMNPETAGDVSTRRMKGVGENNSSDFVPYQLYQNTGRSVVWGRTLDADTLSATGTGAPKTHVIYGLVPSTNFTVGDYRDTVTATVTF